MSAKDRYHHGDLRNALLTVTKELVRERGARGFSMSEAARRAGVSPSAPYRHFLDREALLAAAALDGFVELEKRLADLPVLLEFCETAAQIATGYLGFAREDPARFEVMFSHGVDKTEHHDLLRQTVRVQERFEGFLSPHLNSSETPQRAAELWSLAHGVTDLSIGGNVQHVLSETQVSRLSESAAKTWAHGVASVAEPPVAGPCR